LPQPATRGTVLGMAQRTGRAMADSKPSPKKGRKPPQGDKRQFLTSLDPEVIKQIKQAAIGLEKTASEVMEEAAREWLERHRAGKR
jgi:Ribbon-helix-helix protein, copG family